MKTNYGYLLCFLLTAATGSSAQTPDNGYEKAIQDFFTSFVKGNRADAVDQLYASNPWIKAKADAIANVKTSIAGLSSIVGEYVSHDLLVVQNLGPRFVDVEYVVNCDRQPLRFFFQFYKPKDDWVTYNFGYNSDLGEWLTEKAKNKVILDYH